MRQASKGRRGHRCIWEDERDHNAPGAHIIFVIDAEAGTKSQKCFLCGAKRNVPLKVPEIRNPGAK